MDSHWLEEETIHSGAIIKVKKAVRKGPDGKLQDFDIVEHFGGVAVVPLMGDRVILVRQPRPVAGRVLLEIPAGKLEGSDDDVIARAQAELGEEVGYRAGRLVPAAEFFVSPGYCTEVIHVFLGLDLEPVEAEPEATEEIERVELSLAEVRGMLSEGRFHDSKTIVGLWSLLAYLDGEGRSGSGAL